MVGDNRAPSTIWGLRYDPGSGYVRTLPGDRIGIYLPDGRGMVSGLQMSRADARLPVLLREDSPAGEDLRARLGLRLETSLNNCRRCHHDPMRLDHEGACVLNLNQRRLVSEWEDMP